MAGFQPWDDGCVEIVFRFTLFGIPLVIVIAVCLDSGAIPTPTQVNNLAAACDQWMEFDMMPLLSADLSYNQLQATDKHTSTAYQTTLDHPGGILGGISSSSLPSQLAIVTTLYTALRGRSYRGRTFIPGIPQAYVNTSVNSNTLVAGDVASILAAYNNLDVRTGAFGAHQHVISRVTGGVERPVAQGNKVTTRAMDTTLDTIRRRGANAHRS